MFRSSLQAGHKRRAAWLLVAWIALVAPGWQPLLAAEDAATVRLIVDFGDGVQVHFTRLPWREDMTVLDALSAARGHRRGMAFTQKGSGSTAMVTKILDLANEGDGRNWLYSVNDKPGEMSAGIHKLRAGDTILWKFETYDYNR